MCSLSSSSCLRGRQDDPPTPTLQFHYLRSRDDGAARKISSEGSQLLVHLSADRLSSRRRRSHSTIHPSVQFFGTADVFRHTSIPISREGHVQRIVLCRMCLETAKRPSKLIPNVNRTNAASEPLGDGEGMAFTLPRTFRGVCFSHQCLEVTMERAGN